MKGLAVRSQRASRLHLAGIGSAMLSAVIFGANPMIAKAAYMGGSNDIALVFGSTLAALPILMALMLLFKNTLCRHSTRAGCYDSRRLFRRSHDHALRFPPTILWPRELPLRFILHTRPL